MTTKNDNSASPGPDAAVNVPPTPDEPPDNHGYVYGHKYPNPLIDPAIATTLVDVNTGNSIATPAQFNEERRFRIYVPPKLASDFAGAPAGSKPTARVTLFFGVGPEITLFRLGALFAKESASVLISIPGVESESAGVGDDDWAGIHIPFGYGISTDIIKKLMTVAQLDGISFTVEVMAAYSTGYRGTNQTIINQLVDLTKLTRLIYFDAWYHHDDHPLGPAPYKAKNTLWAIDTALGKSPTARLVIYAFTHPGGVPRSNPSQTNQSLPNPPREPVNSLITKYPSRVSFIDFEFAFNSKPHIDAELEKICLARLIRLRRAALTHDAPIDPSLTPLIDALPERGSFGTLGLSGYTDLYGWISSHSTEISLFDVKKAMKLVVDKKLLDDWTTSSVYEMRHRMFVLELGKEPLLPS